MRVHEVKNIMNLQSEGHGISGFETMLSIGLGQEQQFTLILQTLQQLRDVYGDSVDKIVQGNTSNIVFLKSTDDSMLDTLQKMSGTTHRARIDSKTITRDTEAVFKSFSANEGKVSYTMNIKEEPVISYNDMAFISERNSIVFRAGDSPIWNRNETILPMSWRLFSNTITKPGKEFTLQTIPTLSSAIEFDVRKNQPDFGKMLDKRMKQAIASDDAQDMYKAVYEYDDYDIEQLDPDNYADDIMDIINRSINKMDIDDYEMSDEELEFNAMMEGEESFYNQAEVNEEQLKVTQQTQAEYDKRNEKIYAGGHLSKNDLYDQGHINHKWDTEIVAAYKEVKNYLWQDSGYFTTRGDNGLYDKVGVPYIIEVNESNDLRAINEAAKDDATRTFSDGEISESDIQAIGSYIVTDHFYKFLVGLPCWDFADGRFEQEMMRRLSN